MARNGYKERTRPERFGMTEEMIGPGGEPTGAPTFPSRARMDLRDWFAIALIAATAVRIIASIIAGSIAALRDNESRFASGGKAHAGEVILSFARFGDGVGALVMVALVGLLYWRVQARRQWYAGRRLALVGRHWRFSLQPRRWPRSSATRSISPASHGLPPR